MASHQANIGRNESRKLKKFPYYEAGQLIEVNYAKGGDLDAAYKGALYVDYFHANVSSIV